MDAQRHPDAYGLEEVEGAAEEEEARELAKVCVYGCGDRSMEDRGWGGDGGCVVRGRVNFNPGWFVYGMG